MFLKKGRKKGKKRGSQERREERKEGRKAKRGKEGVWKYASVSNYTTKYATVFILSVGLCQIHPLS